jgi:catechol 2,3-dioxygenase-like lactoylglutathione lyase family enzyme
MKLTARKFSIPVSNQDRALKFYTETLGFELVRDTPFGPEQRWIELRLPGQDVELVLFTPDEHKSRIGTFQHVLFTAPDVFKAYEEMKAKGVEFPMPPSKEPWGVSSVFKDIDGNSFSLASAD